MRNLKNSSLRSPLRCRPILTTNVGAVTLTLTAMAALPAFAAAPPGGNLAAKAFRKGQSVAVKEVVKACKGSNCGFRVTAGPAEYLTAVTNVGSAIINCTNEDMAVEREVTLTSSITDNIEGEISGTATIEGHVDNQTEVTVSGELKQTVTQQTTEKLSNTSTGSQEVAGEAKGTNTNTSSNTFHTAPKDTGPNNESTTSSEAATEVTNTVTNKAENSVTKEAENQLTNTTEATGTVQARDQLEVGVRAAFEAAFRLTAGTELATGTSEKMTYKTTLKPKDILTFSSQNAMVRTTGTLNVNDDTGNATVENITVDSPSTVTASSLIAQTFTGAEQCETLRPVRDAADPQPTGPSRGSSRSLEGLPDVYTIQAPAPGTHPTSTKVLKPVRTSTDH
ncbi:hypothetical protein [Streptomyces albipurpureus]|uniref:DUF3060 domain-containing protein n=1 Tax=Streptomyces albipurpureus TaxID=2897419 RepID=A0ABT0UPW5_9ACTN|nr:hypothetical protein [Streptomyces sp. CWNU-1]MCM2389650.1 hypothetical protein [Streptomyces sp. CWNU-1]